MHRSMDAEMDGWRDGWKDGGRAGNFPGGELLFPPTPPALRDREGLVGDATVEALVLPGGGSRRPEGGRCEQLWGSPSPCRGADRWAVHKAWCCSPLSREEPSVFFTRALPPYSLSLPPGMEPCAAWSPRGGRGTATLPFRAFSKAIGGVGTAGRGRGLTHGAGERVCHRGRSWDPGAWERQLVPPWRHRPVFCRSPLLAGSRLFPSSTSRKLLQAGRRLGPGEAPFTGGTLLRSEDKSIEALWVGHPGSAPVGGHRLGHEGAASWSRQGRGKRPSCVCWRARAGRASGLKLPVAAATCPPHLGKNNNALARACVYVCGT